MATILLLDDSRSVLEVASSFLSQSGHRVITCRSGKDAIERLDSVDLLITDIYMPDEDGLEVIGKVRKLRPDLPILAMSGAAGERNLLQVARHLGARITLHKPFSKDELLAAVAAALSHD